MKKPRRVLVGLKTIEHAVLLTDLACRLGARNASLSLIHVLELPDPTPLDADVPKLEAEAARILRAGERAAHRSGLRVSTRALRAHHAGYALLDEMRSGKFELAVIGYHHGKSIGELLLGTTAQYLAKQAPCHLVCLIPPHRQG